MTDKALEAALLPCKVCNSDDWMTLCPAGNWHVECQDCGYITSQHYQTEAEAVAAWNRRAPTPALPGEAEVVADLRNFNDWLMSIRTPGHELTAIMAGNAMLRAADAIQAMQARVEIAERERDAFRDMADGYGKLDAELAIAEARVKELEEALKPFAVHLDEMKFDLDNHGNELPDEQSVGWVYVTNGDFRRARTAIKGDKP